MAQTPQPPEHLERLRVNLENFISKFIRTSWKTVSLSSGGSYGTLYVNTTLRLCELRYVRAFSSATAYTYYTWHTGAIPSSYRPSSQVVGSFNYGGTLYVDSEGDIGGLFTNGWSSTHNIIGSVMWHY